MAKTESDAITARRSNPAGSATANESFEVVCSDGWRLRGDLVEPARPRAVAITGHAMMVDRRTLKRGLVGALVDAEIAVVCPDLRGHGESGPTAAEGGRWSYDDLVDHDVPALVAFARRRFPSLPVIAVGHSLFGHVTMAHLARYQPNLVDGVALLACNIASRAWLRQPMQRVLATSMITAMAAASIPFDRFPSRLLRIGNQDEALPYVLDFFRWVRRRDWIARDGFVYTDDIARINVPVAAWVGAGDRLFSPPPAADAFVKLVDQTRAVRIVGRRTGLAFDPGHMQLVTDRRCRPVWDEVARFCRLIARAST